MGQTLRTLIIEDDAADGMLLLWELRRGGYDPVHLQVDTAEDMRAALESGTWDIILSDYVLPSFSAPAALQLMQGMGLDLPFIVVSGTLEEEGAVSVLRAGAHDFITKHKLARLAPAVAREIREAELRRHLSAAKMQAEAERERVIELLRDAIEARDGFLAMASHGLKTPVTAMTLQVQGLVRSGYSTSTPEKLRGKIDLIAQQLRRLTLLINNMLDVVHIAAVGMDLRIELVDLCAMVEELVAHMHAPSVHMEPQAARVSGHWDRARLQTVVANLLANAVKFGEGRPIDVAVSATDTAACLTVADDGIGISQEQQARIFDKFSRGVSNLNYGGFGLGLWVVHEIVEAHHGFIEVNSEVGKGSTFTVTIPR